MKDKTKSLTYSGRSTSNKEAGKLKSVRIKYLALGEGSIVDRKLIALWRRSHGKWVPKDVKEFIRN